MAIITQPPGAEAATPWTSLESAAAICAIGIFYVGDFVIAKAVLQSVTLVAVVASVVRDANRPFGLAFNDSAKGAGVLLLTMAMIGFLVSSLAALLSRSLSFNDFGVFVVQVGLPLAILLSPRRSAYVEALGRWAVLFALLDVVANLLAVAGLADLAEAGRSISGEVVRAYPGLSGNTHSAGFVAFAACTYLLYAWHMRKMSRPMIALALLAIFVSLYLISARRYTGMSLVTLVLFAFWRPSMRIGLVTIGSVVAAIFVGLTFIAPEDDVGNALRALLLLNGLQRAIEHPLIGTGPVYLDLSEAAADFDALSTLGVTESQVLDFAISYGIAATAAFLAAIALTLRAWRTRVPMLAPIFLTLMSAELFFGGTLRGFAGTLLFYASFGACLERQHGTSGSIRATRKSVNAQDITPFRTTRSTGKPTR